MFERERKCSYVATATTFLSQRANGSSGTPYASVRRSVSSRRTVELTPSALRYYEVTNAHHLDSFNQFPGYNDKYIPLHRYFIQAMDLMYAHLRQGHRERTGAGEDLILRKNLFMEYLLPLRHIPPETLEVYRRYFRNPGPSRLPMLAWTRDLPIGGEPRDVVQIVDSYARWLSQGTVPKLFIDAEPAGFLIGAQREFCRGWPNQQTITVPGAHFLQEDSPAEVGQAAARFVSKVLAGQIA